MSTHPRDFQLIQQLSKTLTSQKETFTIVSCYGVHPWFLHDTDDINLWFPSLEHMLITHPHASVGEIGLDAYHYNPETNQPHSTMEQQLTAFEMQLQLATKYRRTVSIHIVKAWGPFLQVLQRHTKKLPPKMYFHAFGGKVGVISTIEAWCKTSDVYYGFAPVINFASPKTASVVRAIGIDKIVLETDLEDCGTVRRDLEKGVEFLSEVLGMERRSVLECCWRNSVQLYDICE